MLVLASASPRRAALLRQLGLEFHAIPADVDETWDSAGTAPGAARGIARRKLDAVRPRADDADHVLAADTLGELDGEPIGKPRDADHARSILRRLAGRSHDIHTALAVAAPGGTVHEAVVTTGVIFAPLTEAQIDAYVGTGEPLGKAAAYALQGLGAALIRRVDGDPFNVIGLPLRPTLELLHAAGYALPAHLRP